jgi:hypothetical protein
MLLQIAEDTVLGALAFGLYCIGHTTAGAWALAVLIVNIIGSTLPRATP